MKLVLLLPLLLLAVPSHGAPQSPQAEKSASAPAAKSAETRSVPLKIVIKADDLRVNKGGRMHPAWDGFLEIINRRKIKASIGIICDSLEGDNPAYFDWIKQAHASGAVEFWFHGYDHKSYAGADGVQRSEMAGERTYDDLWWRFDRSEELAKEKLGFPLHTYGAPGGGVAESGMNPGVLRLMREVPEMKVWLYSSPINEEGKTLAAEGKVVVLDRVWPVNIEQPLFVPNSEKLIAGLAKYPRREYFVIQGHPTHWKEEGFVEFEKMLDYLTSQGAEFVTPMECARMVSQSARP